MKVITVSVPEMSQEDSEAFHNGVIDLLSHVLHIDDFCVEITEEDEDKLILELEREEIDMDSFGDRVHEDIPLPGEITTEMIEEQADRFNGEI